ncbi:MAG: dolichol-phosphate mannosyltransferase [Methylomonas sp.]|nr:MAG: dolichol-phosphate mannosyltransferase [Methylomonas sp.]
MQPFFYPTVLSDTIFLGENVKISVVIPVHNEAENLVPLIIEIVEALKDADAFEIIYVNDGSTDATAAVLKLQQQAVSQLRVIEHAQSCGQSTAIHNGVKAAVFPYIATLDGDGQNDPADIPKLYHLLVAEPARSPNLWMVAGWRNKRNDSKWRLFSSKVANAVRSNLLGDNTPDTGCGLKVFLRDRFLELPYFDHMHRFLPALILRAGGVVHSEPVNHRARVHGTSNYGTLDRLWAGITDLLGVIWLIKRTKRTTVKEIERG